MNSTKSKGELLAIIELGGYPNFAPIYQRCGFKVETTDSMRKAVRILKKMTPAVIVAEFNYQSDFRDRTSNLETLMSVVQRMPDTRIIVFYEQEYHHQFERVATRFPIHAALAFPVDEHKLEQALLEVESVTS